MIQVTAEEFSERIDALLAVADEGQQVIITRNGKPSYVLVRVSEENHRGR